MVPGEVGLAPGPQMAIEESEAVAVSPVGTAGGVVSAGVAQAVSLRPDSLSAVSTATTRYV